MTGPALRAADLYHTGIVVPDLEASKAALTEIAGYTWTETLAADMTVRLADGDRVLPLRYAYSLDAPHLELVQEIPGTPWTATPHRAAHHLGYFCDDVPMTAKRLQEAGFTMEAAAVIDGVAPSVFAYLLDPSGVRIEIVERSRIPDLAAYLRSRAAS
ncbi:VOC family protein [Streptomyces sp. NPDC047072]|uniref:VOC family protein n=1 Tax=Streptomyces sp. NPDC047072 TaxID=3154809 RepID=UPI0033F528D8